MLWMKGFFRQDKQSSVVQMPQSFHLSQSCPLDPDGQSDQGNLSYVFTQGFSTFFMPRLLQTSLNMRHYCYSREKGKAKAEWGGEKKRDV